MTNCDVCKWAVLEPKHEFVMGCQMDNAQELVFMFGYQPIEQPCPDFELDTETEE